MINHDQTALATSLREIADNYETGKWISFASVAETRTGKEMDEADKANQKHIYLGCE